ncbi:MAG: CHAD domain-containing protein [Acidobacteria bacterium]|nr:CHAD domain-containing protein [Acidobacteriota bacterium]
MELVAANPSETATGLDFWMDRVLQECDRARNEMAPEPVHDLRVALRRCRSIADVFTAFDSHPEWQQMKNEGKKLFAQLGALRDTQVMLEWIHRLAAVENDIPLILNDFLSNEEAQLKETAFEALQDFSRKKWTSWARKLSRRAQRIPLEEMALRHLALERWTEAYELHRQALRNRTHVSYHRLRIGLKKFRYVIENFLPSQHESWGGDLRQVQDLLGEMHDLHVLWQTAIAVKAFPNEAVRTNWHRQISEAIRIRLEGYRRMMLGQESLWKVWRSDLPGAERIRIAALSRLRVWASFRDPAFAHSEQAAKLALQIYDGLDSMGFLQSIRLPEPRFLLEAAALAHDVGKDKVQKKHEIASYKMIRKFGSSPGWSADSLRCIALIARFHRGALPRSDQKALSHLSSAQREAIILLAGILRLANAFDSPHHRRIRRLTLSQMEDTIYIQASGYLENDKSAENLAAARHLLETACRRPILIRQS